MNKLFLVLFCFSFIQAHQVLLAQNDSIQKHRTIKVSKPKDSTYIKAYTDFFVYYDNPGGELSYRDYVMLIHRYSSRSTTERLKITDTKPKGISQLPFDYTAYFETNHLTKDIKMRPEEADTVRLLVYVTNKGVVRFMDVATIETSAEGAFVYGKNRNEFKIDVSHIKTQSAFRELLNYSWQPAEIAALKTHPSKRKNKYKVSTAFSEGILTVIYSSKPILN